MSAEMIGSNQMPEPTGDAWIDHVVSTAFLAGMKSIVTDDTAELLAELDEAVHELRAHTAGCGQPKRVVLRCEVAILP